MAEENRPAIHAGHRQRVREEFLKSGLEGMPDHRVMEMLLFLTIPRGDVNPLAHRIIDHFGSLVGVFHATYEQLLEVPGLGPSTAAMLQLLPAVSARYMQEAASFENQVVSRWQVKELLAPLFFGQRDELAYLMCLDGGNRLLATRKLGEGVVDTVNIAPRKILEAALSCNASQVILAHNHLSGVAGWSQADVHTTLRVKEVLDAVGIRLLDHVILAGDDMVSMADSGLLRDR